LEGNTMKRSFLLTVALLCALASPAGAIVMNTWSRLQIQFTNLGRVSASDTGIGVATLNGSGGGAHLNAIQMADIPGLSINTVIPITDPVVSNGGIVSVRLTGLRGNISGPAGPGGNPGLLSPVSGAIASNVNPGPGGLGTVPATGMVRICLLAAGCGTFLPLDIAKTVNGVAQGIGVGGILTIGQLGTIRISVLGAPFTVKTVTAFARTVNGAVATFTEKGFAHGPLSNTSSTAQVSGVLQAITTQHVTVVGVPGNSDISGLFGRVMVHFVPEPEMLLMLGSGAAVIGWLGRRRMRR
jgi:hypothetical protein